MPKRKITLDEAFAVFEQHGLQVEIKAVKADEPAEQLSSFLEQREPEPNTAEQVSPKFVKVTLFAAHTVGAGGETVTMPNGSRQTINNGIQTYGPGIITVPSYIAQHLLHQDMLARQADDRMLENHVRQYAVLLKETTHGSVNIVKHVSNNASLNLTSFLTKLSDNEINIV